MYRDKSRINREGLNPTPEVIITEHDQTEISNLQTLVESRNMFNGKKYTRHRTMWKRLAHRGQVDAKETSIVIYITKC